MQGSIRAFVGLLVVIGCAGGLDTATDVQIVPLLFVTIIGLCIMASGVNAMKGMK